MPRPTPIVSKNWISYFFIAWPWRLIAKVFHTKVITDQDLEDVPQKMSVNRQSQNLNLLMSKNEARFRKRRAKKMESISANIEKYTAQLKTMPQKTKNRGGEHKLQAKIDVLQRKKEELQSDTVVKYVDIITWILLHPVQITIILLQIIATAAQLYLPFTIESLLRWYIAYSEGEVTTTHDGWLYGILMIVMQILVSFFDTHGMMLAFAFGTQIRTGLIGRLYDKALTVSPGITSDPYSSAVVQLLFTDSQRLVFVAAYFQSFIVLPLGFIASLGLLIYDIGIWPALGLLLGTLVMLAPIAIFSHMTSKYFNAQMSSGDRRISKITEILQSIHIIKLMGTEGSFKRQVDGLRNEELGFMKRAVLAQQGMQASFQAVEFLATAVMLVIYALTSKVDPTTIAAAQSLAYETLMQIGLMAPMVSIALQAHVAIRRINAFMSLPDKELARESSVVAKCEADEVAVLTVQEAVFAAPTQLRELTGMEAASFMLDEDFDDGVELSPPVELADVSMGSDTESSQEEDETRFCLDHVSLRLHKGETLGVIGPVGSGKTALLMALLNEMDGDYSADIRGSVAYCAQAAWLIAGTVRDNILCGKPYDEERYNYVCSICCLLPDFATLIAGDQTSVGEGGVTLSGGQKQRVALARAVYADADVYILDDVISALDAHVGKAVMRDVVFGELDDKSVIIVTHQTQHLYDADRILVLGSGDAAGTIVAEGTFMDLYSQGYVRTPDEDDEYEDSGDDETLDAEDTALLETARRHAAANAGVDATGAEEMASRSVPLRFYWRFFQPSGGALSFLGLVLVLGLFSCIQPVVSWFTAHWSFNSYAGERTEYWNTVGAVGESLIAVLAVVFVSLSVALIVFIVTRASRYFHDGMLGRVLRAPMAFFDVVPTGRILNRFSRDLSAVDQDVPSALTGLLNTALTLIASFAYICTVHWVFIAIILACVALYVFILLFSLPAARQVKRFDSTRRSPVISGFQSAIAGIISLRAYGYQDYFRQQAYKDIDKSSATTFMLYYIQYAETLALHGAGALVYVSLVLVFVLMSHPGSPAIPTTSAQASLTLVDGFTYVLDSLASGVITLEQAMSSIERVIEYTESDEVPQEPEYHSAAGRQAVENNWPQRGEVEFRGVSMRYRPELPLVLQNVSFIFKPGEKVGVVGRSGSGKSTLCQCLFRIVDVENGQILIDGTDTKTLGLHDLRQRLAVIPQDPTLFQGTLRSNLDPNFSHSDEILWNALESSQLKAYFEQTDGLEFELTASGSNLSAGQRQLVCLARALVRNSRILLCDEATASVDADSDRAVQTAISNGFKDATVITIAHRLDTVATADRVLVMDAGKVAEFDTPKNLLEADGMFADLCRAAGPACWNNVADLSGADVPRMQSEVASASGTRVSFREPPILGEKTIIEGCSADESASDTVRYP